MKIGPSSDQICRHFSVDEIRSATQNFNEELVIGSGGFGKVYKAAINNGSISMVAIKRLNSMSNQGAPEFRAEIEMLSKLRHCNLVSLIGYCEDGKEMVLVYEYMPHGTLEDGLHKDGVPLSWLQRLRICLGAARGLDYLHTGTGTQHGVIHRDVKSSNVLLDENFAAKISDFGLAKIGSINQTQTHVSTVVKGTFGYMDPCYYYTGKLTRRSDVYSFGVVLLQVICGRPAVDTSLDEEQWGLATWAQDRIKKGKLIEIIDSRLMGQVSSNNLKDFARLACRCLHNIPNKRPTMAQIIASLEGILSLQERLGSYVTGGKLKDKFRSFFSGKVQLKSGTGSSESEPSDKGAEKLVNATATTGTTKIEGETIDTECEPSDKTAEKLVNVTATTGTIKSEGEPSDKAAEKLVDATATTKTDLGPNEVHKLIHFANASSYTYEELFRADLDLLRKSNYWKTYRATTQNGDQLVVRQMTKGSFLNEDIVIGKIRALGKLRHTNILTPKAYYYSKDEIFFITDYIKNTSLSSYFYHSTGNWGKPLGWFTRLRIIIGITKGLVYLHSKENIVHGNLKSNKVLLDENYMPLIADAGLSQLIDDAKPNSSLDYAPELLKFQDANEKTDVYSLGLIIFEFLSRKSTDLRKKGLYLPGWVRSLPRERLRAEVFDRELKWENPSIKQELTCMLELAMACVNLSPNARPKAQQVLQRLLDIPKVLPSDKAAEKLVDATATTKTDLGPNEVHELIHFTNASSYTYEELFRGGLDLLSKSNYWTTYRATMKNGDQVVVRQMTKGSFPNEDIVIGKIRSLGKLRHTNILTPKAYYYSKDEIFFITDYIKNMSLSSYFYHSTGNLGKPLGWFTRLSIIIGITKGLVYLHTKENIVHGNLKSNKVLLDEKYMPLIADAGLSQLMDDAKPNSSLDYAPELLKFQDANKKTDVYSLGLIIFEFLSRKSTDLRKKGLYLPGWVRSLPREKLRAEVFDRELKWENPSIKQELICMLELAMACVNLSPNARPKAQQVLQRLLDIPKVLPM